MFGPAEAEVWTRLEAEWDDLRAACSQLRRTGDLMAAADIVVALSVYAMSAMRFEVGDWAVEVLASQGDLRDAAASRLRGVHSWAAWATGDVTRSVEIFDAAARDGVVEPTFYFSSIIGYLQLGDLRRLADAAEMLRVAARADDPRDPTSPPSPSRTNAWPQGTSAPRSCGPRKH